MNFGDAILALRRGERIARPSWNGKDMWLVLVTPANYDVGARTVGLNPRKEETPTLAPWIGMKTAQNMFTPWAPAQSDVLADDWEVLSANDYLDQFTIRIPVATSANFSVFTMGEAVGAKLEQTDNIFKVTPLSVETADGLRLVADLIPPVMPTGSPRRFIEFNGLLDNRVAIQLSINPDTWSGEIHSSATKESTPLFLVMSVEYGNHNRRQVS